MKRYFLAALTVVIVFLVGIIGGGIYLNVASESLIQEQMENRVLCVQGEQVAFREITPLAKRPNIMLYSEQMTDAIARVEGTVTKVYIKRGQTVKEGDLLCEVLNEEIPLQIVQIDSGLAKARAVAVKASQSYERAVLLSSSDAISKADLDAAVADKAAAEAEIHQLEAKRQQLVLSQGRQKICAPINGELLSVYTQEGAFITAGKAIATVGNFSLLRFKEQVEDIKFNHLLPLNAVHNIVFDEQEFSKVYDTNFSGHDQGELQRFAMRAVEVEPPLSVPSSKRMVVWEIDNSTGLLEAGLYSNAKIYTEQKRRVVAISKLALESGQENEVYVKNEQGIIEVKQIEVYIKNAQGLIDVRQIETGIEDDRYVEVVDGLQEGDVVILSGREGLTIGMPVDVDMEEGGLS